MSDRPWPAQFDRDGQRAASGKNPDPRATFPIRPRPLGERHELADYLDRIGPLVMRDQGLAHPYLVPGAVYDSLWTWDAYFLGLGLLPQAETHFRGSLENLLENVLDDGRPPSLIRADGTAEHDHVAQPLHAQWAVCAFEGDADTIRAWWSTLVSIRGFFDRTTRDRFGLYAWVDGSGTGIDNDPAIYGRPGSRVALVDMNCFHYRELRAMARLAAVADPEVAPEWEARAEELRDAINTYMWDRSTERYCHVDLTEPTWRTYQEITWAVQLQGHTWACLFPLWAGVATGEQADRLIRRYVLDSDEFLSGVGIRSSAKSQGFFNNVAMSNPSNWQGPVWGLPTFLVCYGLARYGYTAEADRIAGRLVGVMCDDIVANGTIHEYYDSETGAPLINPDFISWNMLGRRILADLRTHVDPTSI